MPALLIVNPPTDTEFARTCHAMLSDAAGDPHRLEEELRLLYPDAVVRPRELSGETIVVWYVYRDGRWVSSS